MSQYYHNREGLLPPGCKDLIDCMPSRSEKSQKEIAAMMERVATLLSEGDTGEAAALLNEAHGGSPIYFSYVSQIKGGSGCTE